MNIKSLSKKGLYVSIAILSSAFLYFYTLNSKFEDQLIYAESEYCPEGMSAEACLQYLQDKAEEISNQLDDLTNKIDEAEYEQLSLAQKISYYNGIINDTQNSIDLLEVEIAQNNVEIQLLNEEIKVTEENINTASQEINKLEGAIQKRIGISYKYSSYSPLELLLNSSEFESIGRKIQYLKKTREHDKALLDSMSAQIQILSNEKEILASQKLDVQKRQEENSIKKSELFDQRVELDGQKREQQSLLSESKNRQAEYEASLTELTKVQDGVTGQITQLIFQLYQSGQIQPNTPVSKGDIIGLQGMTGLITGSHLHFEYRVNGVITNPNNGCLNVAEGTSIGAADCASPLDGGYITQFPHTWVPSLWNAVDLVSLTNGDQPGSYVWGDQLQCIGYTIPAGWRSTRGQGAFVRAIKDGMVTSVQTDICGGKYVIVDHGNGEASLYLHLK